jgi:copper(I)-binding protein
MKRLLTLAAAVAALLALPAAAHDDGIGDIAIHAPRILATPPNAPVAGGYLSMTNEGETDDVLLSVRVPETVAGLTELHEMAMEDGVMRMSAIEGGIPVPAGETVTLEQGGLHVMMMRLARGLAPGDEVPATLTFRDAGEVEITFAVEARGAGGRGH